MPVSAPVVLIGSACFDIRGRVRDPFQAAKANAGRVRIAPAGRPATSPRIWRGLMYRRACSRRLATTSRGASWSV